MATWTYVACKGEHVGELCCICDRGDWVRAIRADFAGVWRYVCVAREYPQESCWNMMQVVMR